VGNFSEQAWGVSGKRRQLRLAALERQVAALSGQVLAADQQRLEQERQLARVRNELAVRDVLPGTVHDMGRASVTGTRSAVAARRHCHLQVVDGSTW
jgi:hypothetical protein